jgi:ADP-ribose pyrophosphatase
LAGGVHGLPEEHEDIRVVVKTLAEVEALLDAGSIDSGHTLIALSWLLRHRDRLRRLWASTHSDGHICRPGESGDPGASD